MFALRVSAGSSLFWKKHLVKLLAPPLNHGTSGNTQVYKARFATGNFVDETMTEATSKKSKTELKDGQMTAIVCREKGGPEALTLEVLPIPTPKSNEVLVRVHFAGLNYIDTYIRTGLYPNPPPQILGKEASGVVTAVGTDVKDYKEGDRVCFTSGCAYADYTAVLTKDLIRIPEGVSFEIGASLPLQGMTAHYLTNTTYPLKQNDFCLVHAGAGGTGQLIIQMAKIRGAQVIATVGSQDKVQIAKGAGADFVINYSEQDFKTEVLRITNNKGVHVAYDGVGASTWEGSLKSLRPRGMLVLFGNASGKVPPFDPLLLSTGGSLFVTRPSLFNYIADPEEFKQRSEDCVKWLLEGRLKIAVDKIFPASEAVASHKYLESRAARGKVLMKFV